MKGKGRYRLSRSAAVLLVALVLVCAGWALAVGDPGLVGGGLRKVVALAGRAAFGTAGEAWVRPFLSSRLTLWSGGLALALMVLLYLLGGATWRLGRRQHLHRQGGEAGTAAIEFVLVFPIALGIVLTLMQSVMLVGGNLNVHYAAYAAARSAIVWVPEKYSYDEPRNVVGYPDTSEKLRRIISAAVYAVMPVSAGKPGAGGAGGAPVNPGLFESGFDRFHQLYGVPTPRWVQTMLAAKYQYASTYTEVTLAPAAGGGAYGDREDLQVHVRHTLYLSVPYANRFFGHPLPGGTGDYGTDVYASCTLGNQGLEDEIDIEQFPRAVGRGG